MSDANISDDYHDLIVSSTAIIEECIAILNKQNKDSYRIIKVPKLEATIFNASKMLVPNHLFDTQLIQFYKDFLPVIQFTHNLKYTIKSMVYTNEDLSINIDRSPAFILDLEHKLHDYKLSIDKHYEQLVVNNSNIIKSYCKHIHTNINDYSIDLNTITIIFKCMEYDFKFIPYGSNIFTQLFADKLITSEYQQSILELSNDLKVKYLSVISTPNDNKMTMSQSQLLQTYNITPSTPNLSLSQIFKQLFGLTTNITIDNLESALKSTSKTLTKHISFVIISKHNNDFYYDIDNLFDREKLSKLTSSIGVSNDYIDIFKTLQSNLISKKVAAGIHKYNYSDTTDQRSLPSVSNAISECYVLWTNDFIHFKLRSSPVPNNIINKIISNKSSEVIDLYNSCFEQKLLDIIKNDTLISYKQIKYLSFDIDDEEVTFIEKLCKSVGKYIKSIGNINNESNMTDKLIKIIQTEFDNFKPFHISKSISMQPILIYNNIAIQIANRVKKDITQWYNNKEPVNQIDVIIKAIIASNDNIYTKFIASYYLDMSGNN